jgi:hypothetical protein
MCQYERKEKEVHVMPGVAHEPAATHLLRQLIKDPAQYASRKL